MKFVSHLDINRLMSRIIKKSGIDVWYTEGYNQHLYVNFILPLSLGFESEYELLEIKALDNEISFEEICLRLNRVAPVGIRFISAAEPVLKAKYTAYAGYRITFDTEDGLFFQKLIGFLNRDSVLCTKTTKRGNIKEFDIIPKIKEKSIDGNTLKIIVPGRPEESLNPVLILDKFFEDTNTEKVYYQVVRTAIYDENMQLFR